MRSCRATSSAAPICSRCAGCLIRAVNVATSCRWHSSLRQHAQHSSQPSVIGKEFKSISEPVDWRRPRDSWTTPWRPLLLPSRLDPARWLHSPTETEHIEATQVNSAQALNMKAEAYCNLKQRRRARRLPPRHTMASTGARVSLHSRLPPLRLRLARNSLSLSALHSHRVFCSTVIVSCRFQVTATMKLQ